MAYIRKVRTKSGAVAVQIIQKSHGVIVRVEHLGSTHTPEELAVLLALARDQLHRGQYSLFDRAAVPPALMVTETTSDLLLTILREQYERLGFATLDDETFALLCLARIVEPVSKLDSLRVLAELGVADVRKQQLYRCLARVVTQDYRKTISAQCFAHASQTGIRLVLYDVTTLYFEIQKEDEYRKPGMSKERRLEPQIVVGLLVDQSGFPLGLHSFTGNTAETTTILPVLDAFKAQHGLTDVTVVADAGMLSAKNLQALADAGYRYIVGSRLAKIPYAIAEYQQTDRELMDGQILTTAGEPGQRIIYQYRAKRAALDLRNIAKQVAKAERIVNGTATVKRAKFLTVTTKDRGLNQALIAKTKALAGIKGYVTNSDQPTAAIIAAYHQLWHVEASFRMSKADLRARPIFHRKRDSIEAHLTVVLTALAIARMIERATGVSIRRVVRLLRPIRSATLQVNGHVYRAEPMIPEPAANLIQKIRTGH